MKTLLYSLLFSVVYANVSIINGTTHIERKVTSWIEIKNRNLVRQQEDYSCGSASLATILKYYYGQDITEEEILNTVLSIKGLTRESTLFEYKQANGLSFLDLTHFAFSKGFKAFGLAMDIEALKKLKIPIILYVKIRNSEHFTVYKGMDEKYAYLADPSMGNTKIRLAKFKEMFYQREDLKYPGKLLAILPMNNKETSIDNKFMTKPKSSGFIYDVIKIKTFIK